MHGYSPNIADSPTLPVLLATSGWGGKGNTRYTAKNNTFIGPAFVI